MEMRPNGRNKGSTVVVVVDKSSKSPSFDGSGWFVDGNEEVGGNEVAIEKTCEGSANNDIIIEGFSEEWQPLGNW